MFKSHITQFVYEGKKNVVFLHGISWEIVDFQEKMLVVSIYFLLLSKNLK